MWAVMAGVEKAAPRVESQLEQQKEAAPFGVLRGAVQTDFTARNRLPMLKISASSVMCQIPLCR